MNVLLVEDEDRVADFILRGLRAEGWSVERAADGETALESATAGDAAFDVVVLDLMLPGISGQEVCTRLRARGRHVPILMLTALDGVDERVRGLRAGADDYLPKPFAFDELVARIEALHRRAEAFAPAREGDVVVTGPLRFDRASFEVTLAGAPLDLTGRERDILLLFMGNPGRTLARERILARVWQTHEDPLTNIVDVYVARLRRKLGPHGEAIRTVRGIGYRFTP